MLKHLYFLLCITIFSGLISAELIPEIVVVEGDVVSCVTLRQRPEDLRDQMMLSHGLTVVGSFGKILLDPENIPAVKENAATMLQGIVDFLKTVMRSASVDLEEAGENVLPEEV